MRWNNKGHQFDELAQKICASGFQYYIYGAGNSGTLFVELMSHEVNICGFLDRDMERQQKDYLGFPVLSPEKLEKAPQVRVIVSHGHYREMSKRLQQAGWEENINYFDCELFIGIYQLYKYDKLFLARTDISLTERCNLRCKKCNMFMPYYKDPKDRPLDAVREDIDLYFKHVSYVYSIKLLGGEPFLYPHLIDVVAYMGEKYPNQLRNVEIFTNGILTPTEEQLELFLKYPFLSVLLSDYSAVIPYEQHLNRFVSLLDEYHIRYQRYAVDAWQDFGFPDNNNVSMDENSLVAHCDSCGAPFRGLYDGKFYFCHLHTSAVRAHIFADNPNDYFDLRKAVSKKELLEFDHGYSEMGYDTFCSVCRGCQSTLRIPVAEQIR